MKTSRKIIAALGACYVAFAIVASSGSLSTLDNPVSQEGVENKLVRENHGSDRDSGRLSGDQGEGVRQSERTYHGWIAPETLAARGTAGATPQPADVDDFKPNCLIFWTDGCGSCNSMCATIKQLRREGYTVYELDINEYPELAKSMYVMDVPTSIIHTNSQEVVRHLGEVSARTLKKDLKRNRRYPRSEEVMADYRANCLIFWTASWCPHCKDMYPVIAQLRREGYSVYVLDYDAEPELASSMGVRSLPTSIIHYRHREVERHIGAVSAATIKKTLKRNGDTDYDL